MPVRGGSKGRPRQSSRYLSRERLTEADISAFIDELGSANDRAYALMFCAFVDNILCDVLLTYFRADRGDLKDLLFDAVGAPMDTLASRITLAYALGAIDDREKEQLDAIRRIRNAFAHSETLLDFSNTAFKRDCSLLDKRPPPQPGKQSRYHPNRLAFGRTCLLISAGLHGHLKRHGKENVFFSFLSKSQEA